MEDLSLPSPTLWGWVFDEVRGFVPCCLSSHSATDLEKFIATCSGKTGDANVVNERLLIYYVSECVVAIVCVNNVGHRRSMRKPKIELKRNTKKE